MYENPDLDVTDGYMLEDGNWTAIFGMLDRREVDVGYMPITMSSSRLDVVDYTVLTVEMRYCYVYR